MSLSRAITGGAALDWGGRRWWLRITYRVLLDCEEASGVEMLAASGEIERPSARLLRALLWAALTAVGAQWSLREVGACVTLRNLESVHQALVASWVSSMPQANDQCGDARASAAAAMGWTDAWAAATSRHALGLSGTEWLDMTPRQLHALRKVHLDFMRREEMLTGIIASTVANFGFRAPKWAMGAESFMLHPFTTHRQDEGPVTGEMIMSALAPIREELRKVS